MLAEHFETRAAALWAARRLSRDVPLARVLPIQYVNREMDTAHLTPNFQTLHDISLKSGTGARVIGSCFTKSTTESFYDVPSHLAGTSEIGPRDLEGRSGKEH